MTKDASEDILLEIYKTSWQRFLFMIACMNTSSYVRSTFKCNTNLQKAVSIWSKFMILCNTRIIVDDIRSWFKGSFEGVSKGSSFWNSVCTRVTTETVTISLTCTIEIVRSTTRAFEHTILTWLHYQDKWGRLFVLTLISPRACMCYTPNG